jgi:hypothetical protein
MNTAQIFECNIDENGEIIPESKKTDEKPLQWMCKSEIVDDGRDLLNEIKTLFNVLFPGVHELDDQRASWLIFWMGENPVNFQARLKLLEQIWTKAEFHPFVTVSDATQKVYQTISSQMILPCVIRLSSTQPGAISVTCMKMKNEMATMQSMTNIRFMMFGSWFFTQTDFEENTNSLQCQTVEQLMTHITNHVVNCNPVLAYLAVQPIQYVKA